jgi:hypothetical protein
MAELERELLELGRTLEFPQAPDITVAFRARILRPPRRLPLRRALVLAFAVLLLLAGTALAVPQSRSAILHFFHIGGVTIKRVDALPPMAPRRPLTLGQPVSLAAARERVEFRVLVPADLPPEQVFVSSYPPGGQVAFLYGSRSQPRLFVTQFRATETATYAFKMVGPGTTVELVRVGDEPAVWVAGQPHHFVYVDTNGDIQFETLRLAGNTLLWEHDGVTIRLEGGFTKAEAIRLARSFR